MGDNLRRVKQAPGAEVSRSREPVWELVQSAVFGVQIKASDEETSKVHETVIEVEARKSELTWMAMSKAWSERDLVVSEAVAEAMKRHLEELKATRSDFGETENHRAKAREKEVLLEALVLK
jgi:hypothetical protein